MNRSTTAPNVASKNPGTAIMTRNSPMKTKLP